MTQDEFNTLVAEAAEEYVKADANASDWKEKRTEIGKVLKAQFEENGFKFYECDRYRITYVAATSTRSLDTKKVKDLYADIWEECARDGTKSASLSLKMKNTCSSYAGSGESEE